MLEIIQEQKKEDFIHIPSESFGISKTRVLTKEKILESHILSRISWIETKFLDIALGYLYFLPSSGQWSKAREFLEKHYPEVEIGMITGYMEWVDTLIATPIKNGFYSRRIIPELQKGRYPIVIEGAIPIQKKDEIQFNVKNARVIEFPELPVRNGYIQDWNEKLGLPTQVGNEPCQKYENAKYYFFGDAPIPDGIRAVIRSGTPVKYSLHIKSDYATRYEVLADYTPSFSYSILSCRLAMWMNKSKN